MRRHSYKVVMMVPVPRGPREGPYPAPCQHRALAREEDEIGT